MCTPTMTKEAGVLKTTPQIIFFSSEELSGCLKMDRIRKPFFAFALEIPVPSHQCSCGMQAKRKSRLTNAAERHLAARIDESWQPATLLEAFAGCRNEPNPLEVKNTAPTFPKISKTFRIWGRKIMHRMWDEGGAYAWSRGLKVTRAGRGWC